jgi:hypothetical protein
VTTSAISGDLINNEPTSSAHSGSDDDSAGAALLVLSQGGAIRKGYDAEVYTTQGYAAEADDADTTEVDAAVGSLGKEAYTFEFLSLLGLLAAGLAVRLRSSSRTHDELKTAEQAEEAPETLCGSKMKRSAKLSNDEEVQLLQTDAESVLALRPHESNGAYDDLATVVMAGQPSGGRRGMPASNEDEGDLATVVMAGPPSGGRRGIPASNEDEDDLRTVVM